MRQPWWERIPGRLDWELEALRNAGIHYERDREAEKIGVLRLTVRHTIDGVEQQFLVTFPDLYPYFRFEIRALDASLPHHQNPVTKQLCIMGRATELWDLDDSVASMLLHQVPKVFAAGAADAAPAESPEEIQAEPISDYYAYTPTAVIHVSGRWSIPDELESGTLELGVNEAGSQQISPLIRAAVLAVRSDDGRELFRADPRLAARYQQRSIGRWVRSDPPPFTDDAKTFFAHLEELDSGRPKPKPIAVAEGGTVTVRCAVFREEHAHRERKGQGWVFCIEHTPRPDKPRLVPKRFHHFVRAVRSAPEDILDRAPELRGLANKTVAVFGLGCIGAPSALEFARAGVGELRMMDGDYVDSGTVVRWPLGMSVVGQLKTEVLAAVVRQHYPYTVPLSLPHTLGATRATSRERSDEEAISTMADGASLIYDGAAEAGIQHYLADLARERQIPYVAATGVQGGWGGYVLRIIPGVTEGCWMCLRFAWEDGLLPSPIADERGGIQPAGCANPTFKSAGFDMTMMAMHGVRMAVGALTLSENGGYPAGDWDYLVVSTRESDGTPVAPTTTVYRLARHPKCPVCAAA